MPNLELHGQWISVAKEKDVPELALLASKLSRRARGQLLASINQHVDHPDIRTQESTRIALVKLLIAMVPNSWTTIRTLIIDRGRTSVDAEVQFSLFCYLGDLQHLTAGRGLISEAACLVGDYLRQSKSNTGHATWMAGDLLGENWDSGEGVPILIDVLTNGTYAEGRLAALHGLEHAIGNADCSDALAESLVRAIIHVASNDRSRSVRESAQHVCGGVSGCSHPEMARRMKGKHRETGDSHLIWRVYNPERQPRKTTRRGS